MIAFIVLFLPAVLSVWVLEQQIKTPLSKKKWAYWFCLNTMLINFVCFAVKKWILHTAEAAIGGLVADMTPSVACNYLIMAIPLAIVLGLTEPFVRSRVRLEIEDPKDTEGNDET